MIFLFWLKALECWLNCLLPVEKCSIWWVASMVYEQCREGPKKAFIVLSLCSLSSPPLLWGTQSSPHHSPDSGSSQTDGEARHRSSWNHTQMRHKHVDQNFRDKVQKVFCSGWPILKALHKWRTEKDLQWCLELCRKEALSSGWGYSSCFPCQDLFLLYWDWN